jgi:hypothetical protein
MYAILASFVVYGGLGGPPIPQQPPAIIPIGYDEGCGERCREHRHEEAERREHEHEHRGS